MFYHTTWVYIRLEFGAVLQWAASGLERHPKDSKAQKENLQIWLRDPRRRYWQGWTVLHVCCFLTLRCHMVSWCFMMFPDSRRQEPPQIKNCCGNQEGSETNNMIRKPSMMRKPKGLICETKHESETKKQCFGKQKHDSWNQKMIRTLQKSDMWN